MFRGSRSKFWSGEGVVLGLAAVKLGFHLITAGRYGIFRDELYYLACGEHLDWGYVDQPPMIAFVAWVARHLFGDWLVGLAALSVAILAWRQRHIHLDARRVGPLRRVFRLNRATAGLWTG